MDRRHEPPLPAPRRRPRRARDGAGVRPPPVVTPRRVPRVRAAPRRRPDDLPGALHGRRRGAGHRPARAVAQRGGGAGHPALQVLAAAVQRDADLRPRRRPPGRAAARPGAHDRGQRHAAHLGGTAGAARPGLGDQPGGQDRDDVGRPVPDPDVDDRLLDDPRPPAPGARRRQRDAVGRAAADDAGAGPPRRHAAARREPRPGHGDDGGGGGLGAAPARQGLDHRPRRHRGDAQPAPERAQRPADRHPGGPGPGAHRDRAGAWTRPRRRRTGAGPRRRPSSASGTSRTWWRTTSRCSATAPSTANSA